MPTRSVGTIYRLLDRLRRIAGRSKPAPTGFGFEHKICERHKYPVGAGLP